MSGPIHVYLLLDISASMTGAPLEALKQGYGLLRNAFGSYQGRPILLSSITYESTARQLFGLGPVKQTGMLLPELESGGTSSLGKAIRLLDSIMPRPDHHPTLMYLFTDGEPTDDWEASLEAIRPRIDKLYAMACGMNINESILSKITDTAYSLMDLTPHAIFSTFRSYA